LALAWDRLLPDVTSAAVDPGWVKTKLASPGAPGDVSSSADHRLLQYINRPGLGALLEEPAADPGLRTAAGPRLQDAILAACDRMVGVGWDQRRGESPGASAERLASTPRQYRPIADPVLQRSSLGILYGRRREQWGVD
jgi:hypothetical protein